MNGWGLLFQAQFWRAFWIAVQRFHSDRRARRLVLGTLFLLAYAGIYLRIFFWPLVRPSAGQSRQDTILELAIGGALLVCALLVMLLHRWLARRDQLPSLLGGTRADSAAAISPPEEQLAWFLWQHTCVVAALVQRAGSESAMRTIQLPPGKEVATRAWQRQRLLALGVWHHLPAVVRDLLLQAEGHWTETQVRAVAPLQEAVDVLRWTIGLDGQLRPLSEQPKYQAERIVGILEQGRPARLELRASWDLRAERDQAGQSLYRYWIEGVARGLIGADLDEEVRERVRGEQAALSQSSDMLLGARTVGELGDETVTQMGQIVWSRHQLLGLLTKIACGDAAPEKLEEHLYGGLTEAEREEAAAQESALEEQA